MLLLLMPVVCHSVAALSTVFLGFLQEFARSIEQQQEGAHMTAEDDASMPDRITPHPDYWTVWAPSPWPEKNGEPFRVGVYHTRPDAEKATAQWPNLTCWIVEPAKENQ